MPARYDYFAWYTYDLSAGGRYLTTVRTGERRYFRGHQHGVRPGNADIAALQVALYTAVLEEATQRGVAYPGNPAILAGATLRTRSQIA